MRILFLNHNVVRKGGTYYRAYNIGRHLVKHGHSVTLISISEKSRWRIERELDEGFEIIHSPDLFWGIGRSGWDPWDILKRIFYLHGHQWDIVHAWDCRPAVILPALYARQQSLQVNGKLIIDWCDWWGRGGTQTERTGRLAKLFYGPIETFFEENFRTHADGNTAISKALYQRSLSLGVRSDKILLLPQGCNCSDQEILKREDARRYLGLSLDNPITLNVGALTSSEAKLFFDTVQLLFQSHPDCRVVMIGNHNIQVPQILKKDERFIETGYISESALKMYMAACDALLITLADTIASRGRWPSKVNLFLTSGRAVVMTRVGDLAELLEHEEAAFIVDCTPSDIVNKLLQLFNDPSLKYKFENRGRRVANNILAWPLIVKKLENFYFCIRNQ
jgi:glycosyltransferase involved in cell wall biosynthesis